MDADNMDGIYLRNFTTSDTDSIFVVSYIKNTDYKVMTDSFMIDDSFTPGDNTYIIFNGKSINLGNDYRIILPKIKKEYKVTGFKTCKTECGDCIIRNSFLRLDEYQINSHSKDLGFIEIDKDTD